MSKTLIGWNGKSLKEMLEESEELIEKTKRYYGIENLSLKEEDPFRYERAYASLRGALVSARETALHVAASPIVKEIGELCIALYTRVSSFEHYLKTVRNCGHNTTVKYIRNLMKIIRIALSNDLLKKDPFKSIS